MTVHRDTGSRSTQPSPQNEEATSATPADASSESLTPDWKQCERSKSDLQAYRDELWKERPGISYWLTQRVFRYFDSIDRHYSRSVSHDCEPREITPANLAEGKLPISLSADLIFDKDEDGKLSPDELRDSLKLASEPVADRLARLVVGGICPPDVKTENKVCFAPTPKVEASVVADALLQLDDKELQKLLSGIYREHKPLVAQLLAKNPDRITPLIVAQLETDEDLDALLTLAGIDPVGTQRSTK